MTAPRLAALAGAAFLLVKPLAAGAQTDAELRGRVVDRAGAGVEGAEVLLRGPVERQALTDSAGLWHTTLPPGPYGVTVRHLAYGEAARTVQVPLPEVLLIRLERRAIPLDALVVTAGRRLQVLADVPVTTELVTRREIEASGAADLASILTEQTGIQLDGGHPAGAGLMLQGLGSERVLLLVDGQPYIGRIAGNVDASRLPTSIVERVEVVKGPQATMYGSEAMGGVVNVITREVGRAGWGLTGSFTGGTQGRMDASIQADGTAAGTEAWLAAGGRSEDLVPGRSGIGGAGVDRRDLAVKLERPVGGAPIRLTGLVVDEAQRWASGQLRQFADNLQWTARATAVWRDGGHRLEPTIHLTAFDHLSRQGTGATPPPEPTGERQVQRLAEAEVLYGWSGERVQVDAGVELTREALESGSLRGGERTLTSADPFAQVSLRVGNVTLSPGVRASWSDVWGAHVTPRLALMARPGAGLALRASAGTGYRAPSFKELYMEFLNVGPGYGYLVRGSEDLGPETATNLSAGVEWSGVRTYLRAQAFHNGYRDFIETRALADSAGLTVYTYGNVDDGRTRGLELEAGYILPGVSVEGGWSVLDAEDRSTGLPLLGRPRNSGRLSLGADLPLRLRARLTALHTGSTALTRDEAGGAIDRDAYTRLDVRVTRELAVGFDLSLGVDNVSDAAPAGWPGFTGRRVYVTVRTERRWGDAGGRP